MRRDYAATINGFIYGIGETADSAIADAVSYMNADAVDVSNLEVWPMTRALALQVEQRGGALAYGIHDGVLVTDRADNRIWSTRNRIKAEREAGDAITLKSFIAEKDAANTLLQQEMNAVCSATLRIAALRAEMDSVVASLAVSEKMVTRHTERCNIARRRFNAACAAIAECNSGSPHYMRARSGRVVKLNQAGNRDSSSSLEDSIR